MEAIEKYDEEEVSLKLHLHRVGDLINIDGPMLVLFQDDRNNDFYLFDWIDSDNMSNRWLIYKTSPENLYKFLNQLISYKELFESNKNDFYYTDILSNGNTTFSIFGLRTVPERYIPDRDVLFDKRDSKNYFQINACVNKAVFKYVHEYNISPNTLNAFDSSKIKNILLEQPITQVDWIIIKINKIPHGSIQNQVDSQRNVRKNNIIPQEESMGVYGW